MRRTYEGILEVHKRSDLLFRGVENAPFGELPYADALYSGRNKVKYQFDELLNPSKERAVLRSGSLKYYQSKKQQGKPKNTLFTKKRPCILINKHTTFRHMIQSDSIAPNRLGFLFDDALVGRKRDKSGNDKYIWEMWAGSDQAFWLKGRENFSLGARSFTKKQLQGLEQSYFSELLRPLSLSGLLGIICYDNLDNRFMMLNFYVQEMIQNHTRDKSELQLPILPLVICDKNGVLREYKLDEIAKDLKTFRDRDKIKSITDIAKVLEINIDIEHDLMVAAIIEKYKPYSTEKESWITTAFKWAANIFIFIILFPFRKIIDLATWLTSSTSSGQTKSASNESYAFEIDVNYFLATNAHIDGNELQKIRIEMVMPLLQNLQKHCKNSYNKNNLSSEDKQRLRDFWVEITRDLSLGKFADFIAKVDGCVTKSSKRKTQLQEDKHPEAIVFSLINETDKELTAEIKEACNTLKNKLTF